MKINFERNGFTFEVNFSSLDVRSNGKLVDVIKLRDGESISKTADRWLKENGHE